MLRYRPDQALENQEDDLVTRWALDPAISGWNNSTYRGEKKNPRKPNLFLAIYRDYNPIYNDPIGGPPYGLGHFYMFQGLVPALEIDFAPRQITVIPEKLKEIWGDHPKTSKWL